MQHTLGDGGRKGRHDGRRAGDRRTRKWADLRGPNGTVGYQPGSHHFKQNIYIVRGNREHGFDVIEGLKASHRPMRTRSAT